MNRSHAYSIPVKGLNIGQHQFEFALDGTFFDSFENTPIQDCDLKLNLDADRRHDMIVLTFQLRGIVRCPCDRCLAKINLPVEGMFTLIAKLEEEETVTANNDEVIVISREAAKLDLEKIFYDFACLSVPMIRIYECEKDNPTPCDLETRKYLESQDSAPEDSNPIWDEIKTKLS